MMQRSDQLSKELLGRRNISEGFIKQGEESLFRGTEQLQFLLKSMETEAAQLLVEAMLRCFQ